MPSPIRQILVVDTEVTGLDEVLDRPVEVATVSVRRHRDGTWTISDLWDALVNPDGRPISFGAMGTHHITEEMVDYAPLLEAAVPSKHVLRDHRVVRAAHVAKFDRVHVERVFPKTRWICTYKCARTVWRGLESYSNQALRYARGVNLEPYTLGAGKAHRALFDAVVTAELLVQLLSERTPEELVKITCEPILLDEMRFGEHAGKKFEDVPSSYMRWIVGKGVERVGPGGKKIGFSEDVIHTCNYWLSERESGN